MDESLIDSALQGLNVAEWKRLGMNLGISWNELEAIEKEASFPGDIAKKVIRLWMSQEPTWIMLVNALGEPSSKLCQKASQISQEHSTYLTIYSYMHIRLIIHVCILYRCASTR